MCGVLWLWCVVCCGRLAVCGSLPLLSPVCRNTIIFILRIYCYTYTLTTYLLSASASSSSYICICALFTFIRKGKLQVNIEEEGTDKGSVAFYYYYAENGGGGALARLCQSMSNVESSHTIHYTYIYLHSDTPTHSLSVHVRRLDVALRYTGEEVDR